MTNINNFKTGNPHNKLSGEKSPYLLQHASNPVNWRAWNDEAFEEASAADKPVFLSIGYSTCHWCHVMAHESFENEEIAKLINDAFIPVKVDREERPDIDGVYMSVCRLMTGGGGWPLTIILTPDKKPFFAATYIPAKARYGHPGLDELIPAITEAWNERRGEIDSVTRKIIEAVDSMEHRFTGGGECGAEIFEDALELLENSFDEKNGGFGRAPKFPMPHTVIFLLRHHFASKNDKALEMACKTLRAIRCGGIYDHLGGGIHRYSVDEKWLVPHFEKMLYDQALIVPAYLAAYQATGDLFFADAARDILNYAMRDMTAPGGGFYSAEDADSEGVEGKFYVWEYAELQAALTDEELKLFAMAYNAEPGGNFSEHEGSGPDKKNILHLQLQKNPGNASPTALETALRAIRAKLFELRKKRVPPSRDEKILADWNGLMIHALASASRILNEPRFLEAAKNAADFFIDKMFPEKGGVLHRYRDGHAFIDGLLDDHAFMIRGLISLYEASFDRLYLERAAALAETCIEKFMDRENGAFYFTPNDGEKLLARQKTVYDGATPSGNSVMAAELLKLHALTGKSGFEEAAAKLISCFAAGINEDPASHAEFLCSLQLMNGKLVKIVISGNPKDGTAAALITAVNSTYQPFVVLAFADAGEAGYKTPGGSAAAFVCAGQKCHPPVTEPDELINIFNNAY